jgi:hypothetical protein
MARSTVVPARTRQEQLPPSGRQRWTHSGGGVSQVKTGLAVAGGAAPPDGWIFAHCHPTAPQATVRANEARPVDGAGSVRGRKREHLGAFALGEAAPDPVGLMDLQRVSSAGRHRRTFKAHGLGLRFSSGPCGSAFPLRVEKERTGHPATGCVQLPVPQVGVRAWKAPGVRHIDPLYRNRRRRNQRRIDRPGANRRNSQWCWANVRRFDLSRRDPICADRNPGGATVSGIWARSASRTNQLGGRLAWLTSKSPRRLPRFGRIRADPGAVDLQTLDRFSYFDKSLITIFVDLGGDFFPVAQPAGSATIPPAECVIAHTPEVPVFGVGQWRNVGARLLSAVSRASIARFCPKHPLLGPYCRSAVGQGSGGSTSSETQPSTPSAGGTT